MSDHCQFPQIFAKYGVQNPYNCTTIGRIPNVSPDSISTCEMSVQEYLKDSANIFVVDRLNFSFISSFMKERGCINLENFVESVS